MSRAPIVWGDRPPEACEPSARSRAELERARGCIALRWPHHGGAEAPVKVYVTDEALRAVHAHGRSSRDEQGGVLLGRVWREAEERARGAAMRSGARGAARAAPRAGKRLGSRGRERAAADAPAAGVAASGAARYLIEVDATLAAEDVEATGVSFRFGRHTWERLLDAWRESASELELVGWYHTHPNLGAFFSGTDRATQRDLFVSPWMLGLVVDPYREDEAWFAGPASTPVHGVIVDHPQVRVRLAPRVGAEPARVPRAVRVKRVYCDGTLVLEGGARVRVAGVRLVSPSGRGKRMRRLLARARSLLARSLRRADGRAEIVECASADDGAACAAHVLVRGRHLGAQLLRRGLGWPVDEQIGAAAAHTDACGHEAVDGSARARSSEGQEPAYLPSLRAAAAEARRHRRGVFGARACEDASADSGAPQPEANTRTATGEPT